MRWSLTFQMSNCTPRSIGNPLDSSIPERSVSSIPERNVDTYRRIEIKINEVLLSDLLTIEFLLSIKVDLLYLIWLTPEIFIFIPLWREFFLSIKVGAYKFFLFNFKKYLLRLEHMSQLKISQQDTNRVHSDIPYSDFIWSDS